MDGKREARLFFASLPDLSSLVVFRATSVAKVAVGMQPSCCRELLFTIPEILISPAFDNKSSLFIITEESFASTEGFKSKLDKINVKLESRLEVDAELFQYCFTFTLIQKLAPFWNKVGNIFVKERNFLQLSSKVPALNFEISVTNKICLAVEPFLVKMPPAQIEDFGIDFQSLWNFKSNPQSSIQGMSIQQPTCYVLPSLKRGYIKSITHTIPSGAPFNNYNDLKQHWKLSYGYRLPPDECHLFYNISFFGNTAFSYPEWCVRANQPIHYQHCDQEEVCQMFFNDIASRMPTLFTNPLRFTGQSLYWQKTLSVAFDGNKSCLAKGPQTQQNKIVSMFKPKSYLNTSKTTKAFTYTQQKHKSTYNEMQPGSTSKRMDVGMNKCRKNNRVVPSLQNIPKQPVSNTRQTNSLDNKQGSNFNIFKKKPNLYSFSEPQNSSNITPTQSNQWAQKNDVIEIPDSPFFEQVVPDLFEVEETLNEQDIFSFGICNDKLLDNVIQVNKSPNKCKNSTEDNKNISGELSSNELHNSIPIISETYQVSDSIMTDAEVPTMVDFVAETQYVVQETSKQDVVYKQQHQATVVPDILHETNNKRKVSTDSGKFVPCFKKMKKKKLNTTASTTKSPTEPSNHDRASLGKTCGEAQQHTENNVKPRFTAKISQSFKQSNVKPASITNVKKAVKKQLSGAKKSQVATVDSMNISKLVRPTIGQIRNDSRAILAVKTQSLNHVFSSPQGIHASSNNTITSTKGSLSSSIIKVSKEERMKSPMLHSMGIDLAKEILQMSQMSNSVLSTPNALPSIDRCTQSPQVPDSTVVIKKQRAKPKVQNVDVEQMALKKNLSKVNGLTLKTWLKSKGVLCKSNEKKEELVKKVQVYLGLYQEELKQQINEFVDTAHSTMQDV